jgi:hypothetical protein
MSNPINVQFSSAAIDNCEIASVNVDADIESLRNGTHTRETLLAHCLDGVDEGSEMVQGWRDYVATVAIMAGI